MAPRGEKKSNSSAKASSAEEEPLRAIIFAHDNWVLRGVCATVSAPSVEANHGGFDECMPAGCLPLVNVPILAYQLDVLARSGVKDALVLSTVSIGPIRQVIRVLCADPLASSHSGIHVASSRVEANGSGTDTTHGLDSDEEKYFLRGMKIRILEGAGWRSAGDGLRDLEARSGLRPRQDFLLISSGAVFNFNLSKLVEEHRARRAQDKNWLMTSVFRRGNRSLSPDGSMTPGKDLLIGVDAATNQLVKYKELDPVELSPIEIDLEVGFGAGQRRTLNVFTDIVDCGIDVCSPEILVEFRENFDFDRTRDYLRGKLEGGEAEILGNKVCARFVASNEGEYAGQITNLASYSIVANDIINRWAFPIIPDGNILPKSRYEFHRHRGYREQTAEVSKSAIVRDGSVIGPRAVISENATIVKSVIGEGVVVGPDTVVRYSHLWQGSSVGRGARVTRSVVCENAKVSDECNVPEGCVVGKGVELRPKATIPRGTWLSLLDCDVSEDEDNDVDDRGITQEGMQIEPNSFSGHVVGFSRRDPFSPLYRSEVIEESDIASSSDGDDVDGVAEGLDGMNLASHEEATIDSDSIPLQFIAEVRETVVRAVEENHEVENVILEINGLKLAYDRSSSDCAREILKNLVLLEHLRRWIELFQKFVTTPAEQSALLQGLAQASQMEPKVGASLPSILDCLYDRDVVEEEVILSWESQVDETVRKHAEPFLTWLRTAEEEEEEGEEDDEGDNSD